MFVHIYSCTYEHGVCTLGEVEVPCPLVVKRHYSKQVMEEEEIEYGYLGVDVSSDVVALYVWTDMCACLFIYNYVAELTYMYVYIYM